MEKLQHIQDGNAENRKQDHIQLAFQAQIKSEQIDNRFSYEPLLAAHPQQNLATKIFLDKNIQTPIWVSSMTGGTEKAYQINQHLATACAYFKMGMGLGSCRSLLDNQDRIKDFDFRKTIGYNLPFYANLGIAQIELLLAQNKQESILKLLDLLQADGLIIHINPLQEWLQPEGDKITQAPIITIKKLIDKIDINIIVKEVGQGFGKESLRELMQLPIQAIEFAAHGGTNFSKIELLRNNIQQQILFEQIANIGHNANEMVCFANEILAEEDTNTVCKNFIISGGISNFLDGYYLMQKLNTNSIYGQAAALLKYAEKSYDDLHQYINSQVEGLKLAQAFLKIK